MLLRIVPDLFLDDKFECYTISDVRKELLRNQRFKTKYPWRNEYKSNIKCIPESDISNDELFQIYIDAINVMIDQGTINSKTDRLFDLSLTDKKIIATALSKGFKITTGDKDLMEFIQQEFSDEYKGTISPLEMINRWLEDGLIEWNIERQGYVADWVSTNEYQQPNKQKSKFKKLTGYNYPGT